MESYMTRERMSLWLVPSDKHKSILDEIILSLSQRYESPLFEPHVTVYAGHLTLEETRSVISSIANAFSGFALTIASISYDNTFTKTLFLTFEHSEKLESLALSIRNAITKPSDYVLDAHLSLIYGDMDEQEKQRLCKSITLPIEKIFFNKLRAIRTPMPARSEKDVEVWRQVFSAKLKC